MAGDPHKPAVKTLEGWLAIGAVLLAAGVVVFCTVPRLREIALGSIPVVAGLFVRYRTKLKLLYAALPQGTHMLDLSNIDQTIDAFVKKFIASKVPASAALQPECDAAIAAGELLARKALEVYAVKLLASKSPTILAELKNLYPTLGL